MSSRIEQDQLSLALINGPNLNMLGLREPDVYGSHGLAEIETLLVRKAEASGAKLTCFQSNHEGEIIDFIHELRGKCMGVIINPGGLTHTSIALRDALLAAEQKIWEVHLTNIYARESFRHISYIRDVAVGMVTGFGPMGYEMALDHALIHLSNNPRASGTGIKK